MYDLSKERLLLCRKVITMNVLSLFDGISCGMVALERAGINVDVYYASEIDPDAITISEKNYPNIIHLGDVTKWKEWDIPWADIDLVLAGSPCQSVSIIQSKTRKGLDGKSKLFFVFVDILNYAMCFNPNVKFLFENVASMSKESKSTIESCLGVELVHQNSNAFSAQDRPRVYGTNFKFGPVETPSGVVLKDVLVPADQVPEKYWYSFPVIDIDMTKQVCGTLVHSNHEMHKRIFNPEFKCHTLTCVSGGNQQKKVMQNGKPRKLMPIEYERLQTLPDNYTEGVSDGARYTACGNGWTVDVIAFILRGVVDGK